MSERNFRQIRDLIPDLYNYLCEPPESIKLPNYPDFNACVGGFRAHEFSVLCGSTGAGKTSLLANWSAELLEAKVKHFVMSVETGHMDYLARVMSILVNEDLNTGDPIPEKKLLDYSIKEQEKIMTDLIEFSLYDNRLPLEQLLEDLTRAVEHECKIAFIDNLNFFMDITTEKNWVIEMDRVTHELIMFCKRNPIHIVMVMHPKKTVQGTRVLNEFDVKGSSTAIQEANNIFLFNRPNPDLIESGDLEYTDRELFIAKLRRRGKHTGKTILFDGSMPRYIEKGYLSYDVSGISKKNNKQTKANSTSKLSALPYAD